jgi:signal transduction histidine kinase
MSLALVVAGLLTTSTIWLSRGRLVAEDQRAHIVLDQLATNLRIGVTLRSLDLIQPVLENAFISPEVRAVAVLDRESLLLAAHPSKHELIDRLLLDRTRPTREHENFGRILEDENFWVMAIPIKREARPDAGAAPADFLIVDPKTEGETIGTVLVYWDLTAGAEWVSLFQRRFIAFSAIAFVLVAVPTWLLTYYLTRGVGQLLTATEHVQQGNLRYRIDSMRADELGDVMRAFDCMVARTAETTEHIREERARALAASQAKSDFLANMSHELRTPLNAIIGFSELLLEPTFGTISERQQSYVQDIHESGKHLLSLINDILDMAKIEAGKMDLEAEEVDLRQVLKSSVRLVSERATRHNLELSLKIDSSLSVVVADQRKLKQLLFNLLANAVKFTPDGGKVGVRAWPVAGAVRICVWDTGIGIPPAEHDKIFQDFYQVGGNSRLKPHQGTGLGLSLVKKIAELHRGRVWVESVADEGSQFYFELPQPSGSPAYEHPQEIAYV